jgi:hypothetical protein
MKARALKPQMTQMTQMNAHRSIQKNICVHLCHLRLLKADGGLLEILEKIGV